MATLILSAAGAAVGAAVGGPVAPLAGRALGAAAGAAIDQAILGAGSAPVEAPRLERLKLLGSREGAPIPRVFGRMRIAGQVIWASRFRVATRRSGGGKAGPLGPARPETVSRRRTVSLAVALCEGPIDRVGRIWADGRELPTAPGEMRLHRGEEDQAPDPLIAAIEGAGGAPAYRGTAYVVFEELDLEPFGGRVPQFNFEVFRQPRPSAEALPEAPPPLASLVKAVALSPGSGEFALETRPVWRRLGPGRRVAENVNTRAGRPDLLVALDRLQEELPAVESVSLVVCWFGDDLRCGRCAVHPAVETREKETEPYAWSVAGLSRAEAPVVGRRDGRPVYGGTPSDASVIAAIRELKARGLKVMFYPFLLMDVAPGSGKADPYGGAEQAPYPWRGRITLDVAPGRPGSADGSAAAGAEVAAFFGEAAAGDFAVDGDAVRYGGADGWSWRRFVLHYAHLCAAAGGVDAFCVGSELVGLTRVRAEAGRYPAVEALRALVADARGVLGPGAAISYAADWSEYHSHRPDDGSGDVIFNMDALWDACDFVGIDNYLPLTDWREGDHLDRAAGATAAYDLAYLRANVEGGEHFDWRYADADARARQDRTPITDGLFGEPWVYRQKDVRSWWGQAHHDRMGGVRSETPTPWVAAGKPIRFTEIGCPAVDKGANQPNVFFDAKSSESALPHFSSGAADPLIQRRFLQAALGYWEAPERNPGSPVYGGPMIETAGAHVWTWDARPWPDFPARETVWADGPNWRLGHWITGRVSAAGLAETVAELADEAGVGVDVAALAGLVEGYAVDRPATAREALQPLALAYAFDAVESGDAVAFRPRDAGTRRALASEALAAPEEEARAASPVAYAREAALDAPGAVRLDHVAAEADYESASVEARDGAAPGAPVEAVETPLALGGEEARRLAERWLAEARLAREEARFAAPPSMASLEPGDLVSFDDADALWRIDRVTEAGRREIVARRVAPELYRARPAPGVAPRLAAPLAPTPVEAVAVDAPLGEGTGQRLAVFAEPWREPAAVHARDAAGSFRLLGTASEPAVLGELTEALAAAEPGRWSGGEARVRLHGGELASASAAAILGGANLAAIGGDGAPWEVVQFRDAELVGEREWRLTGLLRGQRGTEPFIRRPTPAGARFALLDEAALPLPAGPAWAAERTLRVGPASLPPDHPAYVELVAAAEGAAMRPFAPARLRARRAGGDLLLEWTRRSRLDVDDWLGPDAPLDEPRERYRVTIAAGGRVAREAETDAPRFLYAAAERSADAATGPLLVAVAQLSERFGAGPSTEITIDD